MTTVNPNLEIISNLLDVPMMKKDPAGMNEASGPPLEVDVEDSTALYKAITESNWDAAIGAVERNPEEAKTWVVKKHTEDPSKTVWRFLPIHSACARQPPTELIMALIAAHPEGARCVDGQGMYALHYASGNQASRGVMKLLLMNFPDAAKLTDSRGMLPIHYLACWGPSSIAVVDMVMVANRNIADVEDEDGNTPMDLAKDGDYPEKNAVVAALRRWGCEGQQPTLLMTPANRNNSEHIDVVAMASYKVEGNQLRQLALSGTAIEACSFFPDGKHLDYDGEEEKKSDDPIDLVVSKNPSLAETATSVLTPATARKFDEMDDRISVMEFEKKDERNVMMFNLKRELGMVKDENALLRKTLADVTEQHEALAGMNTSLLAMVEQQEIVLRATRCREEQWEKLASMRRERLRDLVKMEEEDTNQEVDLRNTLAQQAHELGKIRTEMTTAMGGPLGFHRDSTNDV